MIKKAFWVYLALAAIGVIYVLISSIVQAKTDLVSNIISLIFFLPIVCLALELSGRKAPLVLLLFSLLLVAAPVVGIINFDGVTLVTIGKVLLFVPMFAGLFYYIYRHIFRRKVYQKQTGSI
ncbi:MAG: hypothetical protein LWX83_00940 [Anaerolineae bacterium]|nr:hypothetical protein [Anaerolineae bacterium]